MDPLIQIIGVLQIYQRWPHCQQIQIMESNTNKQYTALRKNLDELNFMHPLHPDSVPLVKQMLDAYMKTFVSYQNLKKSMVSQSMNDTISRSQSQNRGYVSSNTSYANRSQEQASNDEHRMNLLLRELGETQRKLKEREQQLEKLQDGTDQHGRVKEVRDHYDNKIAEFLTQIQKFQKRQKQAANEKRSMQQSIQTLNRELDTVKEELATKQRILLNETKERISIRKQYEDVLNTTESQDNRRMQELNGILERKTARIQQLEELDLVNKAKLTDTRKQLEGVEVEQKHLAMENKNLNLIIESLKVQNSDLDRTNSKLRLSIEELNRELDASKKYRSSLEQQIQDIQAFQIERNFTSQTREKAKQKLNSLYQQSQKALQEKKMECETLQGQRNQLQKIVEGLEAKVKEISNKNMVLINNIDTLQEELKLINGKYSQKLKELKEIEVQKLQLQRMSKEVQPTQLKYFELEAKYNQLLVSGEASNDFQRKSRQEYEHQIKILQQEISIMKERQEQSIIRSEKLSNEVRRLETYKEHGNKQMEVVNSQKEALMKENKQLKEQLDSVSLKAHSNKTEGIKQIEKLNSNEILIQDLKNTLNAECQKVKQLLDENRLLEANVKKSEQKNRQLYQDNLQLRTMCESLQHTKAQLYQKFKRTASDRQNVQSEKVKKSEQYIVLKKEMQRIQQALEEKQRVMLEIDGMRDEYEQKFNLTFEENEELKARIKKLEQDLRRYDQNLGESQFSLHSYQAHINNIQNQKQQLVKKYQKLEVQNSQLKTEVNRLKSDLNASNNTSGLLVVSNKDMKKQLEMYEAEINNLKQVVENRTVQLNHSLTELQMTKLECEQIREDSLGLNSEKTRLEGLVRELEAANHEMYDVLGNKDGQLVELSHRLQQGEYKLAQYMAEINSYQKQLAILTNQVNLKDQDFRRAAMERDYLRSEVTTSRRQPQIDWRSLMEERLMQTQCQLELKKRQVESHIIENRKLSKAIEEQRKLNFKLTKEVQEMRYRSHLETPIRNLMTESLEQSQLQNSSIHSNRMMQTGGLESFESNNTINSKRVNEKLQQIKQKYQLTMNGVQSIKSQRT